MTAMHRIPHELVHRDQWVAYKKQSVGGRVTKVPYDGRTGAKASTTNPATWHSAWIQTNGSYAGKGFVFSADDPYFGIDLDNCIDDAGIIAPWALQIVEAFGTFTEITPSERGLHLIGRGTIPGDKHRAGSIEMYDRARFFTMTGNVLEGYGTIQDCQDALSALYSTTFPAKDPAPIRLAQNAPSLNLDDQTIIDAAHRINPKFPALWSGDTSDYSRPDNAGHSEARSALVYLLAGYTKDPAQLERLFQASGLYRTDKWPRERDKLIGDALRDVTWQYEPPAAARTNGTPMNAGHPHERIPHAIVATPCNTQPSSDGCIVELARIAELEQQLAERDETIARLQRRIAMHNDEKRLRQNKSIKAERDTVIEIAHAVAEMQDREHRQARAEGREPSREVKIPTYKTLAERIGCSESKVSRDVKKLRDWGQLKVRQDTPLKPERITSDGVILPAGFITETYVELPADPLAWLAEMQTFEPERENTHGGARTRCPHHPNANIIITKTCAECDMVLDRQVKHRSEDTEKPMQTGNCILQDGTTPTTTHVEVVTRGHSASPGASIADTDQRITAYNADRAQAALPDLQDANAPSRPPCPHCGEDNVKTTKGGNLLCESCWKSVPLPTLPVLRPVPMFAAGDD